jgi:hypothetical protein
MRKVATLAAFLCLISCGVTQRIFGRQMSDPGHYRREAARCAFFCRGMGAKPKKKDQRSSGLKGATRLLRASAEIGSRPRK